MTDYKIPLKTCASVLLLIVILTGVSGYSNAADPKFDLRLTNRNYTSSNEGYFDISIRHTNPEESDFLYAGGNFVIKLDTIFQSDHLHYFYSKDTATYDLDRIPPQYVGNVYLNNDLLKVDIGETIPHGSEPVITADHRTLITRIRFVNPDLYTSSCLLEEQFSWQTSPLNESSSVYFRRNGLDNLINNLTCTFNTYDLCTSSFCCLSVPLTPPVRISPSNNALNLSPPVTLIWQKGFPVLYTANLQIAADPEFINVIHEQSLTAPDGTENVSVVLNEIISPGSYYWRVKQGGIPPQGAYNEPWKFTIAPPSIALNLKVIPEGMYRFNAQTPFRLRSYLRSSQPPFQLIDSAIMNVPDSAFVKHLKFPNAPSGKYYLVVKIPGSVETWSRAGGDSLIKGYETNEYDITQEQSSAFGANLTLVNGKYCIYSGDINQDGFINDADLSLAFSNSINFFRGNQNIDLTGEGLCDLNDNLIVRNNLLKSVYAITPAH